jgi:transposase
MSTERRYPTDLTDQQWSIVEPLLPDAPPGPAGRPPVHSKREIVNAIFYLNRAGCAWRMLPKDFPSWKTVYWYFSRWRDDGTLDELHDALREQVRVKEERRNPVPSAGILDSQSAKGADTISVATRGFDAGKKINGRKRHIVVDTVGLLLLVMVTAANVQDRDGGRGILKRLHSALESVRHVFADGGYRGRLLPIAKSAWGIVIEVVNKPADQRGFAVLPRRWVVERTFSWLMRWRRLVRDYERLPATHEAMVKWAMAGNSSTASHHHPAPSPGHPRKNENDHFQTPS